MTPLTQTEIRLIIEEEFGKEHGLLHMHTGWIDKVAARLSPAPEKTLTLIERLKNRELLKRYWDNTFASRVNMGVEDAVVGRALGDYNNWFADQLEPKEVK